MPEITIDENGGMQFIWDDSLAGLMSEGQGRIERASHVEPTADGRWTADLSPVGGPVLGPFTLRSEALAEEVQWIKENMGL